MPNSSFGQCEHNCDELLGNPTLEYDVQPDVTNLHVTFTGGFVAPWKAFETPHHLYKREEWPFCWIADFDPNSGAELVNCFASGSGVNYNSTGLYYSEGVYQSLPFNGEGFSEYCIEITANILDECALSDTDIFSHVFVKAVSGVPLDAGSNPAVSAYDPLVWPPDFFTASESIVDFQVSTTVPETVSVTFVPTQNNTDFIVYNAISDIGMGVASLEIQEINVSCQTSSVIDIVTNANDLVVNFEATNASTVPYSTFSWDFGNGSTSDEATPTMTFGSYGIYNVCLDVVDENGCCGNFCKDIIVDSTPEGCANIPADLYLDGDNPAADQFSELITMGAFPQNGTISGLDIVVNGSFIFDENFTYNNCQFYFEPGAELIVRSPGNITIVRSTLQGCSRMWKGITVEGTGVNNRFNFQRNTVMDAYHALTMLDGCHIVQGTNVFDANYVGIFSPAASTVKTHFGSPVTGSQFVQYKPMLPSYQGQPFWAPSAFAGIQVFDLTSLIVTESLLFPFLGVGATNLFDRVQNGILFQNTNVGIIGNEFRNIQDFGIEGDRCNIVRVNENNFTDVPRAVSIQSSIGADVVIQGNSYTDPTSPTVGVGQMINVTGLTNSSVKIIGNTCNVSNLGSVGMSVSNCDNMSEVSVMDNSISCSAIASGSISLTNVSKLEGSPGNVANNAVIINGLLADNGLRLTNTNSFAVTNNVVSVNSNASQRGMLSFRNSHHCLVADNQVTNGNGFEVYGYSVNSSLGNIYCCNTSTNTKRGFHFRGPCNNTALKSSVLDNTDIGLYLWNAELGPQNLGGNLWQGASASKATYVAGLGDPDGFDASEFRVNPSQSGTLPTQVTPLNDWFIPSGGNGPICPQNNSDPECGESWNGILPPSVPPSQLCADIEQYITSIAPQRGTWVFQDQYDWMLYYYAFSKRYPSTSVADWSSCYPLTGSNVNVKTVAEYYDINIQMHRAYEPTSSEQLALNTNQALLTTAIDDLVAVYQLVDSEQAYMANVSTIVQLQSDIDMYYATIDNIKSTIDVRGNAILANLIATIQGLATDFPFLIKYKAILEYQVLVMLHGSDYLTATDWAAVRIIADGCELEDGQAVFEARALLSLIGEVYEDSYDACSGRTAPRSLTTTQPTIVVYPNPSYDNVTVSLATPLEGGSSLVLVNQLGRKVHTTRVEEKTSEVKLEVEGLTTGIYILYISDHAGTMLHSEKVIVLR